MTATVIMQVAVCTELHLSSYSKTMQRWDHRSHYSLLGVQYGLLLKPCCQRNIPLFVPEKRETSISWI